MLYRSNLLKECHEINKLGSTRVVYGAGCEVLHVLMGKEFVRLNIGGLPKDSTDQVLLQKIKELYPAAEVCTCLALVSCCQLIQRA